MMQANKMYYTLKSVFSTETICIPVDTKIYMRGVITQEEAKALLLRIPEINESICSESNVHMLKDFYDSYLQNPTCENLIYLSKSIYAKKKHVETLGKKLGQIDQRYWKQAEDLLYNELSIALEIERDSVEQYIETYLQHTYSL